MKQVNHPNFEICFIGKINIFNAQFGIVKPTENSPRKLKAILGNKEHTFIAISIINNKGKVEINEQAFIRLFNFLTYENIQDNINEFIDKIGSLIVKHYTYNIMNKNYFWNEVNNIPKKIQNIFLLSKDNRSLFYKWNSLTNKEQLEFIHNTAKEIIQCGIFNMDDACIYSNKFEIINLLKINPKMLTSYLLNAGIIKNKEDEIQYNVLSDITKQVIEAMV